MAVENTLAYYNVATITAAKSLMVQAADANLTKKNFFVIADQWPVL